MTAAESSPLFDPASAGIVNLEVKDLFGTYSYDLAVPRATTLDQARVVLLYGDNGSGKTTILQLLFHLLSTAVGGGHKSHLGQTSFRRFAVTFANGVKISAERPEPTIGEFLLRLDRPGADAIELPIVVDENLLVKVPENEGLPPFLKAVRDALDLHIYFVSDDRRLQSDELARLPQQTQSRGRRRRLPDGEVVFEEVPRSDLENTLERAGLWMRQQAYRANTLGSESANFIYADVIRKIAAPSFFDQPSAPSLDSTRQRLVTLGDRNSRYEAFGLAPPIPIESLLDSMARVSTDRQDPLLSVLVPFLDGLEARLDAVASIYETIDAYVEGLNSFLVGKQVRVHVPDGIEIDAGKPEKLSPNALSSGERQLLLLMSNTIYARDHPAIFIIDEPEISLNMKWQRKLVDALLACTRGSETQFVLATHSFEVLTSARDRVIQLLPHGSSASDQLSLTGVQSDLTEESRDQDA